MESQRPQICSKCGTSTIGRFCHNCGNSVEISQIDIEKRETIIVPKDAECNPVVNEGGPVTKQRKQLYFLIHTKKNPSDQQYRCAGCSTEFSLIGMFGSIRYCEYSGKYYCSDCHKNDKVVIPARIVQNWDHRLYKVSAFSKSFLESIYHEPVFDVSAINIRIYQLSDTMKKLRILRKQLFIIKDFILTCRERDTLMGPLFKWGSHIVYEIDVYSLRDFVDSSLLLDFIRETLERFITHIAKCERCKAKGTICEFCNNPQPIYPFHLLSTVQCGACKSYFHTKCYQKEKCPKCLRIAKRKYGNMITLENLKPPASQGKELIG